MEDFSSALATNILDTCGVSSSFSVHTGTSRYSTEDKSVNTIEEHTMEEHCRVT